MNKNYWETLFRGPPIIYVHIGTIPVPLYTKDSIEQARLWNPHNRIILLTNQPDFDFEMKNFEIIDINKIPKTKEYLYFEKENKLDKNFRSGFWRYTTERIFVLQSFVNYHKIHHFFHLEYDNLIFCNINKELFDFVGINSNKKLVITSMGSHNEHLMNIFCCNDIGSFNILCDFFCKEKNTHEMVTVYNFSNYRKDLIDILPYHPEDNSNFIIDAAPIGQYLGGPDPLNLNKPVGTMTPGFHNYTANFDVRKYEIKWEEAPYKRPYINNKQVYNLHIHCKVLKEFTS
jgi:hypothetical protein